MPIQLKGGRTTEDKRLDRLVQFDEKSRSFPIRQLIPTTVKPRSYTWRCPIFLDQGQEGACAGFAVSHEAAARPVTVLGLTDIIAREVYRRAQQIDEWPGESYEGTSVLAAVKSGRERGWYSEFRWAFGLDDLVMALGYKGPAILGLNWYEGMFQPDANGFIRPTGSLLGGHAILANAVSVTKRYVRLHNSWGSDWGTGGGCLISFDDLDRLLREQGEACIPVLRRLPT